MKMLEIKKKASALGIKDGKLSKEELIHAIQRAENYTPCYGKSNGHCPYSNCCFRDDCVRNN